MGIGLRVRLWGWIRRLVLLVWLVRLVRLVRMRVRVCRFRFLARVPGGAGCLCSFVLPASFGQLILDLPDLKGRFGFFRRSPPTFRVPEAFLFLDFCHFVVLDCGIKQESKCSLLLRTRPASS